MNRSKQTKSSPIFKKILVPMILLILFEVIIFVGSIFGGGITSHLNKNAADILRERVINRKNYLENEMVSRWSNIDFAVQAINEKTERLIASGEITVADLDDSSDNSSPLLLSVADELISLMRSNRVTGAYMILNHADLDTEAQNKPGIYIRDLDPISSPSSKNNDLLLLRAPSAVVHNMGISTDTVWKPAFSFSSSPSGYSPFFYNPFQNAYLEHAKSADYANFGYWSEPYTLPGDDKLAISYSVPLILSDGTVYGVLGIDITLDYLRKIIPYSEILDDKKGSYILAVQKSGDPVYENILVNGPVFQQAINKDTQTFIENGTISAGSDTFVCSVENLNLYNTNTPFSSQQWVLIGTARNVDLYAFSNQVSTLLLTAIIVTLIVGIFGCLLTSKIISRPVVGLSKSMDKSVPGKSISLDRTGISEIDRLAFSIENLNEKAITTSKKFTDILGMASVKLSGFEYDRAANTFFVTDNFFNVLQIHTRNTEDVTLEIFQSVLKGLEAFIVKKDKSSTLYKLEKNNLTVYIRIRYEDDGKRCFGLIEDVTQATIEREVIEHERDYDLLTGLKNRRAFQRILRELFHKTPEKLKTAALMMIDLDNLKTLNDRYGHDCGDKYIRCAAECFVENTPDSTVVSRISGDEFYLLFYGYETKEQVREQIHKLYVAICERTFLLPSQERYHLRVSGGIAWYPDDSTEYETLMKYSDFAMYKVKQSHKGEFQYFDDQLYRHELYLIKNKDELSEMIEKAKIEYHFQPIVSAKTGEIFAYEGLMRANMPNIKMPDEVLTLARYEGKLNQIEELTYFCALKEFTEHISAGRIQKGCKIFLNSISNQVLSFDKLRRLEQMHGPLLKDLVVELTEEEKIDETALKIKKQKAADWHAMIAIDDFGSGYNNDKMLLLLAPDFIKIDIAIIRGIDENPDKKKIVENVVSYAHERGIFVVAEGVETPAETSTVIALGVDYLQGYFIAKPKRLPTGLEESFQQFMKRSF